MTPTPRPTWPRLLLAVATIVTLTACGAPAPQAAATPEPSAPPVVLETAAPTVGAAPPSAAVVETDALVPTPADPTVTEAPVAAEAVTEASPTDAATPNGATPDIVAPSAVEPVVDPPASSAAAGETDLPTEAQQALVDGDYARAIAVLEETLRTDAPANRVPMVTALARAYRAEERHGEAIAVLAVAIEEAQSADDTADILALLATSYEAMGEWRAAADAYQRYLELRPEAAPEVHWHIGKAHAALQEWEQAEAQIAAIDRTALSTSRRAEVLEELASVRLQRQDVDGALSAYEEILTFAQNAPYRALVVIKQGDALRGAGRNEEAAARYTTVINEYAGTYSAYTALDALDLLGVTAVSDLDRARILYQGGQYEASIEALHRYLPTIPGEQAAPVYYLAGQAFQKLERYDEAIQSYDAVISQFPGDSVLADAWLAKASAVSASGGDGPAVYQAFAAAYPDHASAPEALWLAANALERARDWPRSGLAYRELRARYPGHKRAAEAFFREGLSAYAAGDLTAATTVWTESLGAGPSADERSRLHVWLGLAASKRGDGAAATSEWQQAQQAAPTYYYGLRARDLLAGISPTLPAGQRGAVPETTVDAAEWQAMSEWVSSWAAAGENVELANHPLALRGRAYLALGWHNDAVTAYRALLDAVKNDPRQVLALTRESDALGLHAVTLSCANRLRTLGREAGASEAPDALWGLSYPTTYGHLVAAECGQRDVDPLLFLALTRQESGFDSEAVSYAGATGLTQVMPATGADIAKSLGEGDYRPAILTRPAVSVRYGVYYLAMLLDRYDRDWIAALVGYNAGPGNMQRWTDGEPVTDHDLFYETLPLQQPQDYIRLIYQNYSTYVALYRK